MIASELLKQKFPNRILESHQHLGDDTVVIERAHLVETLKFLKGNPEIPFDLLLDLCGVDYLGQNPRFEVVYHLYSLKTHQRLRVRTKLRENDLILDSVVSIWETANWYEREAYDMFGIYFNGHPNLKRLLMWTHFEGHPLRKDYPIQKRQPIPTLDDIV